MRLELYLVEFLIFKYLTFVYSKFHLEFTTNCWLLTCSWSYLASASGCHLQLQGFVSNRHKTVKLLSANDNIKSLAACDRFCLVLLDNGKLYKCLPQCEDIQLEEVKFQGNQNRVSTYKRSIFSSKYVHNTDSIKIKHIACGNNIMVAIGIANELFTGTTQSGFQFPTHVHPKQLVCGFEHALLLTSNGDIYSWGNGLYVQIIIINYNHNFIYKYHFYRRGQLGHDVLRVEETPTILEALAGIKVGCI